jgi:hypothetical protein
VLFLAVLQCGRAERMWRSIGLKEEVEMLVGNGTAPFLLPPKPPTSNLRSASAVFGAAANCRFGPSSRYWKARLCARMPAGTQCTSWKTGDVAATVTVPQGITAVITGQCGSSSGGVPRCIAVAATGKNTVSNVGCSSSTGIIGVSVQATAY